jgi:hypothetical protein
MTSRCLRYLSKRVALELLRLLAAAPVAVNWFPAHLSLSSKRVAMDERVIEVEVILDSERSEAHERVLHATSQKRAATLSPPDLGPEVGSPGTEEEVPLCSSLG